MSRPRRGARCFGGGKAPEGRAGGGKEEGPSPYFHWSSPICRLPGRGHLGETSSATSEEELVAEISKLRWRLWSFDSKAKHVEEVLKSEKESRSSLCHWFAD